MFSYMHVYDANKHNRLQHSASYATSDFSASYGKGILLARHCRLYRNVCVISLQISNIFQEPYQHWHVNTKKIQRQEISNIC